MILFKVTILNNQIQIGKDINENSYFNDYEIYFENGRNYQFFLRYLLVHDKDYKNMSDIVELIKSVDLRSKCNYWQQMSRTQFQAIGNVLLKSRSDSKMNNPDSERFRLLVIDAFEEAYSALFSSKEFSVAYNEVYSKQLDFINYINKIVEKNLNLLNIPTRSELDQVLKDLQEMKKTLRNIKNGYEKPVRK